MNIEVNCRADIPLALDEASWLGAVIQAINTGTTGNQLPAELKPLVDLESEITGILRFDVVGGLVLEMIAVEMATFYSVVQLLELALKQAGVVRTVVLEYSETRVETDGAPASYGGGVAVIESTGIRLWKTSAFIAGALTDFEEVAGGPHEQG